MAAKAVDQQIRVWGLDSDQVGRSGGSALEAVGIPTMDGVTTGQQMARQGQAGPGTEGIALRSSDVDSDTRRRALGARDSTTDLNRIQAAKAPHVGLNHDAQAASAYEISR